jgi:hypothetical protein
VVIGSRLVHRQRIAIDGDHLSFEFPGDDQNVEITAAKLQRRLGGAAVGS